jgi:hypothetical protein
MATADKMERDKKRSKNYGPADDADFEEGTGQFRNQVNPRNPWKEVDKIAKSIGDGNAKFRETITPSTDFRDGKALDLAELDYQDTTRELSKAAQRMEEAQQNRAEAFDETGYYPGAPPATQVTYRDFLSEQAALDLYWRDLGKAPPNGEEAEYWNKIVSAAESQGIQIDPEDAKNLTDWRLVNFASDRMVKLMVADPVNNSLAVQNIAESLERTSPELASMGFMLANSKFEELAKDPNLAQKGVGYAIGLFSEILEPFVAANEFAQQNWRAGVYNSRAIERDGGSALRQLYGTTAGILGYNRSMVEKGDYDEDYLATLPTALDSQGNRLFSDIEIEIAMLLHMGSSQDPEFNPNFAVEEFLLKKPDDEYAEGYRAFGNVISNTGPRAEAMATLMRQIDSAHDGNSGQIGASSITQKDPKGFGNEVLDFFGVYQTDNPDPVVYDPERGTSSYQDASNVMGFATSVIIDPTIGATSVYRGVQATRYALSQVAPQASKNAVGAEKLLSPGGGFLGLNNKTYRFFRNLSDDLNDYEVLGARVKKNNERKFSNAESDEVDRLQGIVDENEAYARMFKPGDPPMSRLEVNAMAEDAIALKAAKKELQKNKRGVPRTDEEKALRITQDQAAYDAKRARIQRRYNQIPDDLITDIIAVAPRVNRDGAIVPRVADNGNINQGRITAESIADFANNKNNDYVLEIANIQRVALAQGELASTLPKIVQDILAQKRIESFDQALSRGAKKTKRAEVTPQMTSGAVARGKISDWIASNVTPNRASVKILQEYVDSTSPKTVAKSFSDNAAAIGQDSSNVASGGLAPSFAKDGGTAGLDRVSGLGDSLGRMFSSISKLKILDYATGDDAGEVYKYARQFLPKGVAQKVANAYRDGDVGSRRLLMSAVVRASAQSRGLVITKGDAIEYANDSPTALSITGTKVGESYGAAFKPSEMPTIKLGKRQDELAREEELLKNQTVFDEVLPDNTLPRIIDLADSEEAIFAGDFATGMAAWRAQIVDDELLYDSFRNSQIGTGASKKYGTDYAKDYKPGSWIDEDDMSGLAPMPPGLVGATTTNTRFIKDGTLSRQELQDIADYLGPEDFFLWMRTGQTGQNVAGSARGSGGFNTSFETRASENAGRRRDGAGDYIPGWKGVPEEWTFGSGLSAKRIDVPWAQGGTVGRGLSRNKTEEAVRLREEYDDQVKLRFDEEFESGALDQQLDDWMILRRDQGDPRFAPKPARPVVVNPEFRELVERAADDSVGVVSLSADDAGVQSALHMYQTRTHMRLPDLSDFEDMRRDFGVFGKGMYAAHKVSEEYTNFWSIFTLFGWRFSIRNAVEEIGMWFGTAGGVVELAKGRAASTNRRRVDREMYVMEPSLTSSSDAVPRVVWKAEQGLIGRTVESARVKAQELSGNTNRTAAVWQKEWSEAQGLPGYLMRYFIIPAMGPRTKNTKTLKQAQINSKYGKRGTSQEFVDSNKDRNDLIAESIVGSRVGNIGLLNDSDAQIIRLAGENSHMTNLIDDVSQAPIYINSARNPAGLASGRMRLDATEELPPGVMPGLIDEDAALAALNEAVDKASIKGLSVQRINGSSMKDVDSKQKVNQWHHILRATLQGGDELTSTIAVQGIADMSQGLTNSKLVKEAISAAIRNDPDGKYQLMFSRLSDDAEIEKFASNYFDDILNLFQTQNGGISTRLIDMFTENGVYQGWAKPTQLNLGIGKPVTVTDRVTPRMLRGIPPTERPTIMTVDRSSEQYIPYANTLPAIVSMKYSDRLYRWMGRQNARLSREPIFWANVLSMWGMSKVRRTNLSQRIAEAKGQVWDDLDDAARQATDDMTNELVSRDVFERAYSVSMSFLDNPANRSNLAWKARNVSRYYRASEDFYRRMGRIAVSNPEAYAKFAIGYSLLDDTGIVYTDDNGDKYFQYPMNNIVQDTLTWFLLKSTGLSEMETGSGFSIGGKVLGSTPSLDPMNIIPPFTSGTGSIAGAAIFRLPALRELAGARALVMGQFNQPNGDLLQDVRDALLPAGLTRMWNLIDTDARESNSASSTLDAVAIMTAEGLFDTITLSDGSKVDREFATEEEINNSKEMQVANIVAMGLEATKLVFAYAGPSYPMINANNVSEWARLNGYDNMTDGWYDFQDDVAYDPEYLDMVEEFTKQKIFDPWAQASMKWFLMRATEQLDDSNEYGWTGSFVPYTISGTEFTGSSVLKQARFRSTEDGYKFLVDSETGYASFPDEHKAASLFLAPREGEFDWSANIYAKNLLGLRVPKDTQQNAVEIVQSEAIAAKRRDSSFYAQRLDALDKNSPAYDDQVSLINKQKKEEWEEKGYTGATDNVYAFLDSEINRDDANESYAAVKSMLAWKKENEGLEVFPEGSTEALMEEAIGIWDASLAELEYYSGSSYDNARKDIKAERTAALDALQVGNAQVKHFRDSTMWG